MSYRKRKRVQNLTPPMVGARTELASALPSVARSAVAGLVYLVGGDFSSQSVGAATNAFGFSCARTQLNSQASAPDYFGGTMIIGVPDNTLRIGRGENQTRGLIIDPARRNFNDRSRITSHWSNTASTVTQNATAGPDGQVLADRITNNSTIGFLSRSAIAMGSVSKATLSLWVKAAGAPTLTQFRTSRNGIFAKGSTISSSKFKCVSILHDESSSSAMTLIISDARNGTANGGIAAAVRDDYVDCIQIEEGKFRSSYIHNESAGHTNTRSADIVTISSNPSRSASGKINFYARFEVPIDSPNMSETAANECFLWNAGDYYIKYDTSTRQFKIRALNTSNVFVEVVSSQALELAPFDIIELFIVFGGGGKATLKWKLNGGAVVTSGTNTVPNCTVELNGSANGMSAVSNFCSSSSNDLTFPGIFSALGTLEDGSVPF